MRLCTCNKIIRSNKSLNIGVKRKIQSIVGLLKTIKKSLTNSPVLGSGFNRINSTHSNKRIVWQNVLTAYKGRVQTGVIINLVHKDVNKFLQDCFHIFQKKIKNILKSHSMIKVNTLFSGEFIKKSINQGDKIEIKSFNTKNAIIDLSTELQAWYFENVCDQILKKLSEFQERDSGFAIQRVINLEVNINRVEMGNGSSFIPLPDIIQKKHACINVKNTDQACFYWAVVSALFPISASKSSDRTSSYPYYKEVLKTEDLFAPLPLNQVEKFERVNDISVNVYALELEKTSFVVVPARLTKTKRERHVNLLLIQNQYFPKINDYEPMPIESDHEDIEIKYHYCWIKNLSRLVSLQLSKHKHKKFICDRCLNYFSSDNKLKDHEDSCSKLNECKISFAKYEFVEFKNHIYKQKAPFIIYSDFESMLVPIQCNITANLKKYQKHIAYSVGYYLKCSYDNTLSYFKSYRGEDCLDWFANELSQISVFIESKIKIIVPTIDNPKLCDARECHICESPFKQEDKIVRDHNHFTGVFRGFAHESCNLNFKKLFVVPIAFHNLSGYDSHFIIKHLARKGTLTVLPCNKERFISFTYIEGSIRFRFIDPLRFLGDSLENLMQTMSYTDFSILKSEFLHVSKNKFQLLMRKGVFCYDYIDNMDKLSDTCLPSIEKFYNNLDQRHINNEDYAHAQSIWQNFEIQNLGDYSDLYLKTDILGLADIFENFRLSCQSSHRLDPAWYFSMPQYTWDCMLQYTGCKLRLLQDIDQIMFVEQGIRGGISSCINRYGEANNKYLDNYDPSKPSTYLLYLDVNNLYGKAMTEPLPYDCFEWVADDIHFDVMSIPDDSKFGYILQVDLAYPPQIHDLHKDFPFCVEHRTPPHSKQTKLIATLYNKEGYILHYRNLKQALSKGLILTKIHKILKFKQSAWLKPYIELNNRLRTKATTTFEKNLYKLFNNACFGKTMENIRKHRVVKLTNSWEGRYGAKNLISSHRFLHRIVLEDDLMLIELKKNEIIFNKPLYIGMAILDISKLTMYSFHYDYMLPKMGVEQCKLLYTDTDSFIYELKCDDVYRDVIKLDNQHFDTSDYPVNNPYDIPQRNKKVLGLLKDETSGQIITHFIGLRSKMYTFKIKGEKTIKKAKGVKYEIVKNKLTYEDYLSCLKNLDKNLSVTQRTIQSFNQEVFSIEQNKIALNGRDDKRHLLSYTFDTLPFGHYSLH